MFINIKFIAGHKAPATYSYCNENLFRPTSEKAYKEPLHLTDFKKIEIVSTHLRQSIIKCQFTEGTKSLATAGMTMLKILQQFIYDSNNAPDAQQINIPIYDVTGNFVISAIVAIIAATVIIILSINT